VHCETEDFIDGKYDTGFIPKHSDHLHIGITTHTEEEENVAMIAAYIDYL
jgi:acetyl-CoA carboxylase biotin carboxylase subunit